MSVDKNTVSSILLLLCTIVYPSISQSIAVPVEIHLPILFKVLMLEKGTDTSVPEPFVIAVVYESSNHASVSVKNEILAYVDHASEPVMNGQSVDFIAVDLKNPVSVQKLLHETKAHAVYVAPVSSAALQSIMSASHNKKMLSMTGVPEYVEDGISLGIGVKGESPEIIVNLASTKEEGWEFGSKVLSVARIVQ